MSRLSRRWWICALVLVIANQAYVGAEGPTTAPAADEARRLEVAEKYGAEVADTILDGVVRIDMTMAQVLLTRGTPTRKEAVPPDAELWHYPGGGEVAFSNGRVTYVQLPPKAQAQQPSAKAERIGPSTAAPSRPLGTPSGEVPAPSSRVGDNYLYESVDPERTESRIVTRRTVISAANEVVLSSINVDNKKAKPRNLHFDRQWNLKGVRNADGGGFDYSPPLKYFDFPLYPGKTWHQVSTEINIKTGQTRTHTISGVVGQWEDVSVPAGSFRAIKVSLQTQLFDPSKGETIPGTDTSWYVPEVRRSVKSATTGKDGDSRLIQLLNYELN